MNHIYKTVFNKSTQTWMAVCEYARSVGCGSASGGSKSVTRGVAGLLTFLSFAVLMALQSAHANTPTTIIADKSANKALQPIVLNTASGVVSVNIATPNARGLSNNHYSQFDVGSTGAVLNNNRKAVGTQIAGFVAANPYMARGEASTILNQVNSNNPSHLGGFIEVAGKKADVIIANPSGLVVNGAGFINAGNVHLAAANSQVNQGQVTGYEVGTGHIGAHGKLNLQGTDYAALIAKTAQINDEIYAGKQLDVILGENSVSLQDGNFNQLSAVYQNNGVSSTSQQGVALDISNLGGMYAGKIHLIGTDKGFGVNNQGVVTATGNRQQLGTGTLTLDSQGNLVNTGKILAKDAVAINTHDNTTQNTATLFSEQADIAINSASLNNTGIIASTQTAKIAAKEAIKNLGSVYGGVLQVDTGKLNNTGQLIQTGTGKLDITTDTLINTDKAVIGQSLYGQTSILAPSTPSSDQRTGSISSEPTDNTTSNPQPPALSDSGANAQTKRIPTARGHITATSSIHNTGDQALITATGDIGISANQTSHTNQASIDVQSLNTNTLVNTDSKIALDEINWQLTRFDNSKGGITAKDGMVIDSESTIINTGGSLTSGGDMTLIAKDSIINQDGTIAAAKQADITAKELQNGGTITADTLTITQLADYTHTVQDKLVANRLAFTTSGKLINQSQLTADHDLTLNAKHIDNTQAGIINSGNHTQITSQTDITNQGLINGDTTIVKATNTINNLAGGRIYGTHLAIQADTLNNTPAKAANQQTNQENDHHTSPVIAARERLDIGVNTLNNNPNPDRAGKFNEDFDNQALITSLGSLHIGGSLDDNHHAIGKAQAVVNKGATIESGGQMQINTSVLKNENADFKSKVEQKGDPTAVTEYFVNGKTYVKKDDEVYIQETGWEGHWEKYLVTPDGKFNHYSSYEYSKTDYTTKTVSSDPAMIRSGGSLSFDFNQASNIDSVVISGDTARLNQDPTHAENFGFINHASTGEDYHTQRNNKYFNHVTADRRRQDNPLSKRPYTDKNLVKEVDQPQQVLHSEYQLPILNATINTTPSSAKIDELFTDSDVSTIIKDVNDDTITLPTSALYIINADDPNLPLIQTDPAFTDDKQWLSSDYMLKALQSDPNHTHKRLYDGYGEQERIKDQYYLLTGRHINTDYSSHEDAYKTLMDNGITVAKQFSYTLGVALTAKQMANLITDIVWLVKQPMTVVTKDKDGNSITKTQDALVPKLYLRSANIANTLTPDGRYAAMSGKNMHLQLTGNLDNNGNIIAKDTANINANNVTNDGGIYGNFVAVTADNTIANHGTMYANSAMGLDAGNQIINQSQTTTQTNTQGQSASSNTAITRIATIRVGDGLEDQTDEQGNPLTTLNIQAGNYVLNKAANIQNDGGNTELTAQNGINITTLTTNNHINAVADPNNYFNDSQSTDVGSTITSAGNLTIATTGKGAGINIQGLHLNATGATALIATGDISITEGRATQSLDTASKFTDKGLVSKKTTKTAYQMDSNTSIQSMVGGETVLMKSGGDMQIVATNVLADKDILLTSGGNMTIASATNTQSMHEYSQVDKKGLFATSPTSVTLGKQRTQNQTDAMQTTYTGSLIGTTGGNVSLVSNDSLVITNSNIIAQKDGANTNTGNIYIQATDATIQSQNTISNNSHRFAQKTTGVTASVSSSLVSEVQSLETLKESVNDTDSRKAKLAGTLAAASKVRTLAKDLKGGNLGSIRVQATIGSQSTKSQTTSQAQDNDAANLLAQNNLIVNLKGKGADSDLTVIGSNLTVGNNFYQSVEGDVLYQASTQTDTTNSQNSSKGWGAGVYASTQIGSGQSNQGFTINAHKAKGSSSETTTTHTTTQVTAGGTTVNDIGGNLILDGANLDTKHLTGTVGGDLIVKSRQDAYQYTHDQKQAGFSADVGFDGKPQGFSINGGKTDVDADYAQVTHQSGIKVKESTLSVQGQGKFTGGYLITDAGKNQTQFAQGIQTQDIQNHLNYEGDAISVGIGIGADTSNPNGKAKPALQGLGYGTIDPVNKTSTTHAAITDQAGLSHINTGLSHINTENFKQEEVQNQLNEIITNDFNKEQVLKELGAQVNITTEFDNERRAVRSEFAKKAEGYRKEAKNLSDDDPEKFRLEQKAQDIEQKLRIFDGITSALYATNSNGIIGGVARAASPELAYQIGQHFKENKFKNEIDGGNRPEEQSVNHLLAHAVLGAAVSAATGNDIATGALAGASSEYTAPILATYLYGKDPKELTQEQKDTITSVLNLATVTTAYTATDGSTADAVSAAEVGKVGVENNANIFINGHWNKYAGNLEKLTGGLIPNLSPAGPGKEKYWDWMVGKSFIPSVKEFLESENEKDIFIDGSSLVGMDQDGKDRFKLGYQEVNKNIDKYKSLLKSPHETFKIISHSEGGAYGAGMAKALIDKGYKAETVLSLSPDEATDYPVPSQPTTYQIHSNFDLVSPFAVPRGTDYVLLLTDSKDVTRTHTRTVTAESINRLKKYLKQLGSGKNSFHDKEGGIRKYE